MHLDTRRYRRCLVTGRYSRWQLKAMALLLWLATGHQCFIQLQPGMPTKHCSNSAMHCGAENIRMHVGSWQCDLDWRAGWEDQCLQFVNPRPYEAPQTSCKNMSCSHEGVHCVLPSDHRSTLGQSRLALWHHACLRCFTRQGCFACPGHVASPIYNAVSSKAP